MTLNTPTFRAQIANSQTTFHAQAFNNAAVSVSFTPAANALLLCLVATNRPSAGLSAASGVSDTSGLTWTRQVLSDPGSGTGAAASIWTAPVGASPSSTTVTVAYNASANASSWEISAVLVDVTDSSGSVPAIGTTQNAHSTSGLPTFTLTGVSSGSYIFTSDADWGAVAGSSAYSSTGGNTAMTVLNNATGTNREVDANYGYHYAQSTSTVAAGSITITATAPSAQNYSFVGLEVAVPASASGYVPRPAVRLQAVTRSAVY
jgi:hypothetical protein